MKIVYLCIWGFKMSLRIYTHKEEIPNGMKFVNYNDLFFNGGCLRNDTLSRKIMKEIDQAEYSSENTFIGRDKCLGSLNKEHLSTGCKTLLNIVYNPDKCFDVIECGVNALNLLPLIQNGNILWEMPVLHYIGDGDCDIVSQDIHFTKFRDFLKFMMD